MGLTISKEQLAELPIEKFEGKIFVIDNEGGDSKKACEYLSKMNELGFDTETKPSFRRGQVNNVALMQLATEEECFLFRLNKIGYPDELVSIMSDPGIKR